MYGKAAKGWSSRKAKQDHLTRMDEDSDSGAEDTARSKGAENTAQPVVGGTAQIGADTTQQGAEHTARLGAQRKGAANTAQPVVGGTALIGVDTTQQGAEHTARTGAQRTDAEHTAAQGPETPGTVGAQGSPEACLAFTETKRSYQAG